MGFREHLKDEMEYQGITTKELADKSEVNKRTIDHYLMANPQEPSVSNAVKIARALKVSVEYLVTGEEYGAHIPLTGKLLTMLGSYLSLSAEQREVIEHLIKLLSVKN